MSATAPRVKKSKPPSESDAQVENVTGLSVSPALFGQFQRLIHEETGIWLGDSKKALLCGRLSRRLRALGISSLDQYYDLVTQSAQDEERLAMIDAITTNETRFFREAKHFEFMEQRAIPRWRADAERGTRSKALRLWSAGCSSGEEPYSLAMLLAANLPVEQGWHATILATDISTRMLERVRRGVYSIEKSVDIPESFLKAYMLKGIAKEEGQMKVMVDIHEMVECRRLNLTHGPYPPDRYFDAILCRNVLIYFDLESKHTVLERLTRCLAPGGLLFVGHAENLSGMNTPLRSLIPAVYARAGENHGF